MTLLNRITATLGNAVGVSSTQPQPRPHPLDPISASEIASAVHAIRAHAEPSLHEEGSRLWFKSVQLLDPPKKDLAPYLDRWHAGEVHGDEFERRADLLVGHKLPQETTWYEYTVCIPRTGTATVSQCERVPEGHHVPADMDEMIAAQDALMSHPKFLEVIKSLDLPTDAKVLAEGWIYGADSFDDGPRYISFMCYLSFSDDPDSCHYAAPLPIIPTVYADTLELVKIEYCPVSGVGEKTLLDLRAEGTPFPWQDYAANEYDAGIRERAGLAMRSDVKPYRVHQPEGASFSVEGRVLRWQKWTLHIGFNYREGLVLNDVRYDGRKVFYRLSVSDMTVPYGDPRAPYHRKQAFDLGDVGAGLTANELQLGCDCLGEILYLDFDHLNSHGDATNMKGVVCIHEQDEGIGWKHTNFRTGKPAVTRSRVLVLQTIITVANYEYIFAWKLDQAAGLHLETRATGILSTAAIVPGESSPFGNVVSPGVLATNHQHLFSVRIDPSIDGHNNTVVQEDSVPMPFDKANPPADNRFGVGYTVAKTPITQSGFADAAPHLNRVFKIQNPNVVNPISGRAVGYKLVPAPSQLLLAHPDSVAHARAEFGDHHIFVTAHRDNELFSGGRYTNQSNGKASGIRSWIARKDNVDNADLVLWHTFGLTHNPRVEDFPVMPCETHMISLKPADFFTASPAIDVPASTQRFNQSKLFENKSTGPHFQATKAAEAANGHATNGEKSCCK